MLSPAMVFAQSSSTAMMGWGLWVILVIVAIAALLMIIDVFVGSAANASGASFSSAKRPASMQDGDTFHRLTKGKDINLSGSAKGSVRNELVSSFAVQPQNFRGLKPIPKMMVAAGDEVLAGQPIFFDKERPDVLFVSPVSGEVAEIKRGAKRAITEVIILADKEQNYVSLGSVDIKNADRNSIRSFMMKNGLWPLLRQRPFDVMADTDIVPRDIFVSSFDSAPLAPNLSEVIAGKENEFQAGLDALSKLTDGSVHLGLDGKKMAKPSSAFSQASGVKKHYFSGPHPAGNVGIQIHHTAPIKQGDHVWTLSVQDVAMIGSTMIHGKYDASRVIALTGQAVENPGYVKTIMGARISELVGRTSEDSRIISGDVLSGSTKASSEFLNAYDDQITVIPEGAYHELFGWLMPGSVRPTASKSFFSGLTNYAGEMEIDTNTHGEERAFVVTGQYEQMLPVNTYPQHLFKSVLTNNIERMEGLGILELIEEDVALCEFACTSKAPLQKILRDGLTELQAQG